MSAHSTNDTKSQRIVMIRHAQSAIAQGSIAGRLDVDARLPKFGDFSALRASVAGLPVLGSGAKRCEQTGAYLGLAKPQIIPALFEQDFGLWEGKSWQALCDDPAQREYLAAFWRNPAQQCPPQGESFTDVYARVAEVMELFVRNQLVCTQQKPCPSAQGCVMLVHAGTIRAVLAWALNLSAEQALKIVISPLSITQITLYEQTGALSVSASASLDYCNRLLLEPSAPHAD